MNDLDIQIMLDDLVADLKRQGKTAQQITEYLISSIDRAVSEQFESED